MWTLLALAVLSAEPAAQADKQVVVIPFGEVDPLALTAAKEAIEAHAHATVRFEPARPLPPEAFWKPRKRWRAERLLASIDADPPKDAWKVVAVTAAEISTTKGNIEDWGIAGLGTIGGRSCVVSTFLYKKHSKTRAQWLKRFSDVVVHEFGHTLGMPHCESTGCVMADAKGKAMKSADQSTGEYCAACRALAEAGVLKP